jgi:hypothetical protein
MSVSKPLRMVRRRRLYQTSGTRNAGIGGVVATVVILVWALNSGRVEVGVFAAFMALLTWRVANGGFHVGDDDVRLSGFVFSRRMSWADVDRFETKPFGRYPLAAYVVLRDGRQFTSVLVASSGLEVDTGRVSAKVVVEKLNQFLVDRRIARVQSA